MTRAGWARGTFLPHPARLGYVDKVLGEPSLNGSSDKIRQVSQEGSFVTCPGFHEVDLLLSPSPGMRKLLKNFGKIKTRSELFG